MSWTANRFLELGDRLADCTLGNIVDSRSSRKAALFGDRAKYFQRTKLQSRSQALVCALD